MSRRVLIETYGCQMNIADSELIQGILQANGYLPANALENAEVVLLNTCAVREKAEERIYGRLANLVSFKKRRPGTVLGVIGCMAEHLAEELTQRVPELDLVLGPDHYRDIVQLLEEAQRENRVAIGFLPENYGGLDAVSSGGVNGWLPVQRGCNQFCTYCVVPLVRGRERCVPPDELERQARRLVEQGVRSVTLLGQTVNNYRYEGLDFAGLIDRLAELEGLERIRFTSPHPKFFSERLIRLFETQPKLCEHVHLPVQSGSDRVLAAMRRGHTAKDYVELVAALRQARGGMAISTDLLVGFPGEDDEDFEATCSLVRQTRFASAFSFAYSERGGTHAAKHLPDEVPDHVKKARLEAVIKLQEDICAEVHREQIGRTVEVLVEGTPRRSPELFMGSASDNKAVLFPRDGLQLGDLVEVEVSEASSHTLKGRVLRCISKARVQVAEQASDAFGVSQGPAVDAGSNGR
ncbi:MAG: tRNA (N6-isopentenyl adenosine(37)-C2)-methylthiotransferase MiaB [Myxococcota bacterium]|nr:tRNA (N6-isopentenyl adenosine(37)-C2)-methylthiotransferase MiaB [Myxococcota bacterium]